MTESIENRAASTPASEKVSGCRSMSVAVAVVTAVVFSATTNAAVAPPPSEVMTGRSFTGVTFTVIVFGTGVEERSGRNAGVAHAEGEARVAGAVRVRRPA